MDSQAHPLPHGLSWSSPLCSVRFPRDIPFFDPAGMLVDFDRGAVQHQRCFVHQILLNQGCEDIFPYSSFCPGTEPAVHTLPWPEPLRQIPPWYSGVQPIQDCVEHFTVAFSWPASLRLFFRWKLVLDPIPLFFTDFMSFHVLYFTISALYTQYLSFQTDSRPCLINGRMPKSERFFRQSRRIFAGGLTPGKKIQRRVAEKDLPLGRFDIFQTWPKLKMCRWHIFLTPRQRKEHSYRPTNTITLLGLMVNPPETGRGAGTVSSQVSTARVHSAEAGSSGRRT